MDELLRMLELAGQGFHCSQILLSLGLEAQGKQNPDLIRSMAGLAGGVGFSGDVCGVLTGGACLLALYAGRGTPEEEDHPRLNLMIGELVEWFSDHYSECYGGIHCRDILDNDPANQTARCPGIVVETYEKVKSLLVENGFDLAEGR
ncbi:MAG: C_GCAxxG_C_C family protein [Desulfomonile tiedjei]|nr:C_GCAxxG_C_C family protein [Desulfomonile tiedjei]